MQAVENRTYDELTIGETASLTRELQCVDANGSGDDVCNPRHQASAWAGMLLSELVEIGRAHV